MLDSARWRCVLKLVSCTQTLCCVTCTCTISCIQTSLCCAWCKMPNAEPLFHCYSSSQGLKLVQLIPCSCRKRSCTSSSPASVGQMSFRCSKAKFVYSAKTLGSALSNFFVLFWFFWNFIYYDKTPILASILLDSVITISTFMWNYILGCTKPTHGDSHHCEWC